MAHTPPSRRVTGWGMPLAFLVVVACAAPSFGQGPLPGGYTLKLAPLEIYDRLPELQMGQVPSLSEEERKLLTAVWESRVKMAAAPGEKTGGELLLEGILFASGVEEPAERKKYRDRFEDLVSGAREAMKGASDDRERGERLMRFLHKGVMSKGYVAKQTSFTAVFDSGQFNCVSSTAMYYLVGTRLGLELRVISIPGKPYLPGHASLDLVEGKQRIQVEPTNADGFDWQAKINRPGVRVIGLVPDRKNGHEVAGWGIAAMIYSNRGVALGKSKRAEVLQSIRCHLSALALDPTDRSAINNLLSVFVNWGPALAAEQKFEEAARVLALGLVAAPNVRDLRNNHGFVWSRYIEATLEAGRDQEALTIIRRAAKAIPDDRDYRNPGHWFSLLGEKRVKDHGWEAGLEVVDRGLKVLSQAESKGLLQWRSGLFRRWSQALLKAHDAEGSQKVLARAYALDPRSRDIHGGIAFHTQEALRIVEKRSGLEAAAEHFDALRKQFPGVDDIADSARSHAVRAVQGLTKAGKFKEAVEAVDRYRPLLTKPAQHAELGGIAYDGWARSLTGSKEWEAAVVKYGEGLQAFPGQKLLANNAKATVDQWARPAMNAKNWDEAIRIYDLGLKYLGPNDYLQKKRQYCEKMKDKGR